MSYYLLNEDDRQKLKDMIAEYDRRKVRNDRTPSSEPNDHQAPETYIALTPPGGIAAYVDSPGTGSGSGTSFVDGSALVSSAECRVVALSGYSDIKTVRDVLLTKVVHNITKSDIPGDSFILISRDKFGKWCCATEGGGGSSSNFAGNVTMYNLNMTSTAGSSPSVWYDFSDEFDVPPGAYHFTSNWVSDITASSTVATKGVVLEMQLYDVTAISFIQGNPAGSCFPPANIGDVRYTDVGGFDIIFSVDVRSTLKLRARSSLIGSSGTLTIGSLRLNGNVASFHQIPNPYYVL